MEINWLENAQYNDLKREFALAFPNWKIVMNMNSRFSIYSESGKFLVNGTEHEIIWWLTGIRFALEELKTS